MSFVRRARGATATVLALAMLSWSSGAGWAQATKPPTPQQVATAKELLILKGGDSIFHPIIAGVIETVKNMYLPTNPGLGKELNEVAAKLRADYEPRQQELLNQAATVYAEHFSEDELKQLVAFYKTPLGRKMVTDEPVVIDESLRRAQTWADALSGDVIERFREEMKKKGHNL